MRPAASSRANPTSTPVHLLMLGTFHIEHLGERLALPTRKAAAILAILSIDDARMHSRDRIASILWGDSGPEQAKQSLRQALFTVRRACGDSPDPVASDGEMLSISRDVVSSDVQDFESFAHSETTEALIHAVDLYQGDFLEGFHVDESPFENWAQGERERLRQLAIDCHTRLLARLVEAGRISDAIQIAIKLLAIEPTHEASHRTLMRLFMTQGRRDAAIRQYNLCSDALFDALRIQPSPETTALFNAIRTEGSAVPVTPNPPEEAPPTPQTARVTEISPAREGRKLVLLIEDTPLNQKLIVAMLDSSKFDVIVADDGAKALLQMGKHRFDLILLDLTLPRLSGFDVLDVMKEHGDTTPVIVLTAVTDAASEARTLEAGAVDYIRKPIHKAVLLKRIERVLG